MACNCVEGVDAMLAERNTRIMMPITFGGPSRPMIVTDQIETGRGKKRACGMFATFCPFCGERYEPTVSEIECHGLDTPQRVLFYEQDFYVLSNFSAFTLFWDRVELMRFDTSEAAYHWEKFPDHDEIRFGILNAPSAHAAFKLAEQFRDLRRPDWDDVKVDIMRNILRAKASQHEYVQRKLLSTGERELVENSWRDDFWGWGPNRDGQNMLGKLWMEIRAELRADAETEGEG